ncbi:hypothetical protein DICVIV_05774 [Dictyocaulus viviparus]|uniref:Uncharacterized protein n=1 Tax=Dictyocaulus viviparus TaxID=29172 RepID=A0A0D8XUB6_DICVI|nr:hypothetical protein DICVIV_05774 [Dictyocaulus viviparus]
MKRKQQRNVFLCCYCLHIINAKPLDQTLTIYGTSVSLPPSARQTPMRFGDEEVQRSSLGSSDSHSSVSRSEDYSQDYVAEEDETVICGFL